METLVNHLRVSFSGVGEEGQEALPSSTVKEKKLQPQKTQSFKGEKKAQNWLRRQFSSETSQDDDGRSEFATAVAAAAAAIHSIEESKAPRNMSGRPGTTLSKSLSRKEDIHIGEASIKKPEVTDQRMPQGWGTSDQNKPTKVPSMRKTPTSSDNIPSKKIGTMTETRPPHPAISGGTRKLSAGETKADNWEKAELMRINKRYEKMNSTINSWEKEKKAKVKRRNDKIESEIERRRLRASRRYHNDFSRINQITGGAKAVALERRRDEELKVKEKANKIRSTGKVPVSCFGF